MRPARSYAAVLCGGLLLSGCASELPQTVTWVRPPEVPNNWSYRNGGFYAPSLPSPNPPPVAQASTPVASQPVHSAQQSPTLTHNLEMMGVGAVGLQAGKKLLSAGSGATTATGAATTAEMLTAPEVAAAPLLATPEAVAPAELGAGELLEALITVEEGCLFLCW